MTSKLTDKENAIVGFLAFLILGAGCAYVGLKTNAWLPCGVALGACLIITLMYGLALITDSYDEEGQYRYKGKK